MSSEGIASDLVVRAVRAVAEDVQLVAAGDVVKGIVVGEHRGLQPSPGAVVTNLIETWPAPLDDDPGVLVGLAEYLTAWRAVSWAGIRAGSEVEVFGGGWRGRAALDVLLLWGATATMVRGRVAGRGRPPDAILVCGVENLVSALTRCGDQGSVAFIDPKASAVAVDLYSDVHRRGLRVRGFHPNPFGAKDWRRDAPRVVSLLDRFRGHR